MLSHHKATAKTAHLFFAKRQPTHKNKRAVSANAKFEKIRKLITSNKSILQS